MLFNMGRLLQQKNSVSDATIPLRQKKRRIWLLAFIHSIIHQTYSRRATKEFWLYRLHKGQLYSMRVSHKIRAACVGFV